MGREAGEGTGMGNTCKSMANSCQCMAKPLQYYKVISLQLIKKEKDKGKEREKCYLESYLCEVRTMFPPHPWVKLKQFPPETLGKV